MRFLTTLRRASALCILAVFAAGAQEAPVTQEVQARFSPEVERQATSLFAEIMSPYCPGMTLTTCPSPQAAVMKDSIRRVLAGGETPEELMNGLERAYGPDIRSRPPARGMGLLAWIGPFALLGLGGIGLTWWLRRSSVRQEAVAAPVRLVDPTTDLDESTRARLEAALRDDG